MAHKTKVAESRDFIKEGRRGTAQCGGRGKLSPSTESKTMASRMVELEKTKSKAAAVLH